MVKAQTDLDAAREARDAAKKVLDSRQQLFKDGALAGKLVDDAQVAYAQANGQYRAADEHLKALQSVSKEEQIKGAPLRCRPPNHITIPRRRRSPIPESSVRLAE